MAENNNIGEIVRATTEEIITFVAPCLGKKEYGNLRFTYGKDSFPLLYTNVGIAYWELCYEYHQGHSDAMPLAYSSKVNLWGKYPRIIEREGSVEYPYKNREEAILAVKEKVNNILKLREAYIRRWGLWNMEEIMHERIILGPKYEELYADSEIELMKKVGFTPAKMMCFLGIPMKQIVHERS